MIYALCSIAPPSPNCDFDLCRDALGRLAFIDADGWQHENVEPRRAFPISDADFGISICDAAGHELCWIERLSDVPPAIRTLLNAELSQREFMPIVRRIVRVAALSEPSKWIVETDRGRTEFLLESEEDVHRIDANRAMIVDKNRIRYLIADISAIDAHSRRILDRYL